MTRSEAEAIVAALVKLREGATDAQALAVPVLYPAWRSGVDYVTGQRALHGGTLYKCVQAHTSQADWTPDATPALWVVVSIDEYPEWVQPIGAHDAYAAGAKVKHNGKRWVSDVDNNTWAPGTYGWTEVTA